MPGGTEIHGTCSRGAVYGPFGDPGPYPEPPVPRTESRERRIGPLSECPGFNILRLERETQAHITVVACAEPRRPEGNY